jgi:hypothetical protein
MRLMISPHDFEAQEGKEMLLAIVGRRVITGEGSQKERLPCSATGSKEALGPSNSNRPTVDSGPRVCMNVRALYQESQASLKEVSEGLHSNPLLLSTTQSLRRFCPCQEFAECVIYVTKLSLVVTLNANHIREAGKYKYPNRQANA